MSTSPMASACVHVPTLGSSGLKTSTRVDRRSVFHRKRGECRNRKVSHVTSCSRSLIRSIGDKIRRGETSAEEVTKSYLATLAKSNEKLGSFVSVTGVGALASARAVDQARTRGEKLGPLAGIPIAIKDNICVTEGFTTAGSKLLANHKSPYDATVFTQLKNAGCVLLGKTNMDEFGMGSTTGTGATGKTKNPWDLSRVPGGSSGGSAAAVASGQCVAALGSDTGGSIRQPASFCGVVGLKPTFGLVSRHGLVSYASSFDCIGPVTSSVEDAAFLLTAMCDGVDDTGKNDSTKQTAEARVDYTAGLIDLENLTSRPLAGKRFALIKETVGHGVDQGVIDCVINCAKEMENLGACVDVVSCPTFALGLPAYYILALAEASSNLARYDAVRYGVPDTSRTDGFGKYFPFNTFRRLTAHTRLTLFFLSLGDEVKRRVLMGSYALSYGHSDAYYGRAQATQTLVEMDLGSKFTAGYHALLTPAAPSVAYPIDAKQDDPLAMFAGDAMTVNVNLAGLPAIVIRGGFSLASNGTQMPVGVQMIGKPFGEAELLANAHAFELATFDTVNKEWAFRETF